MAGMSKRLGELWKEMAADDKREYEVRSAGAASCGG